MTYTRSAREHDFLKYIRIVMKWAKANNPALSKGDIELLLYLYPKGPFTKYYFKEFYKTLGLYQSKALDKLRIEGYVEDFLGYTGTGRKYVLTHKAKLLCSRMHKMLLGLEEIPTTSSNKMYDSGKAIDKAYLKVMESMNKEKGA